MTLTMIPHKYVMTIIVILAAFLFLSPQGFSQDDDSPTACTGNDMEDLKAAIEADPANIGLRMRTVRLILDELPKTDNRRRRTAMLEDLQNQLDEIKKLGPEFTYVYRVLARQHERRREFDKVLEVLDEYAQVTDLDYDMRVMRVRALLRMGNNDKKPDPAKTKEAAEYVATWFSSGTAPIFSETLASEETWMIDQGFRRALLKSFKAMYDSGSTNTNLLISYASALYVSGRHESAWAVMQGAEQVGLCDDVTGGRHPLTQFLEWRCPEDADVPAYTGLDLEELRERSSADKDNLSLTYRLAVRLKAKAYTGERIVLEIEERIKEFEGDLADAERESKNAEAAALREKIKGLTSDKEKIAVQVRDAYEEALPLALAVKKSNPEIDSVALLLADITSKLDKPQEAVKFLKESIKRVPFFVPLRDKLAGIYALQEDWAATGAELVGVCRLVSCRAESWEGDEEGPAWPVPAVGRERLIAKMAANPKARPALIAAFESAIKEDPRNPNLQSFLSMIYFFGKNKAKAAEWMRKAEVLGVCGSGGFEHDLATFIYSRKDW